MNFIIVLSLTIFSLQSKAQESKLEWLKSFFKKKSAAEKVEGKEAKGIYSQLPASFHRDAPPLEPGEYDSRRDNCIYYNVQTIRPKSGDHKGEHIYNHVSYALTEGPDEPLIFRSAVDARDNAWGFKVQYEGVIHHPTQIIHRDKKGQLLPANSLPQNSRMDWIDYKVELVTGFDEKTPAQTQGEMKAMEEKISKGPGNYRLMKESNRYNTKKHMIYQCCGFSDPKIAEMKEKNYQPYENRNKLMAEGKKNWIEPYWYDCAVSAGMAGCDRETPNAPWNISIRDYAPKDFKNRNENVIAKQIKFENLRYNSVTVWQLHESIKRQLADSESKRTPEKPCILLADFEEYPSSTDQERHKGAH